jgi:TetR/AcrR family transcriptional repressor of mexJK operon
LSDAKKAMTEGESSGAVPADPRPRRGTGGRPSQAEARRRDERLVEIAARMFMDRGFDATTIDAVAEAANVGKATLYARYRDKAELFAAVFRRQIDRWVLQGDFAVTPTEGEVADVLLSLARRMIEIALTPDQVSISRIIMAQAVRFPELAKLIKQEGWQRSNAMVATVLRHFTDNGQLAIEDVEVAADLFLSLVMGRQTRLAILGFQTDPAQLDERTRAAVTLFLDGTRPR